MKNWFIFKHDKDKKHLIIYGIVSLLFTVVALLLSVFWVTALAGGAVLFGILQFRIGFTDKCPVWIQDVLIVILALIVFIIMQITISCGIFLIGIFKFIMNVLLVLGATALLWAVTGKMKASVIFMTVFTQVFAVADHLVVQARSFEIQFSDFASLGTAAQVADQYEFELSEITKIGILLAIVFITALSLTKFPKKEWNVKQLAFCLVSVICAALCVVVIYTQVGSSIIAYQDKYWKYRGSERNGFFVNMIYSASATRVLTPEGYEDELLEYQLDEFLDEKKEDNDTDGEKKRPNVIVIMNETFSDVQHITEYMGGEMNTDIEVTPFLDSLDDAAPNIIKGHALSSVYGGNTANSELEFLTGLSVQFIPRNTVAYNLYMNENNSFTLVDSFNQAGYKTVAIHPENPTNWSRDKIYDFFGFDEKYFKGDFEPLSEDDLFRTHVSDATIYDKIIELYESKEEGTPLFNFTITMQNHSGFSTIGFDYGVEIEGMNNYTGIREYLTSINNSDTALKGLIEYFEKADEETVIVFFGDHQPSLANIASKFYGVKDDDTTLRQQSKYAVPYFLWANFDIETERETELTSINFLSTYLRDIVDIPETKLSRFVEKMNSEVMAINAMGWFDYDYNFHESSYSKPELNEALKLYSYLQYNMLFEEDNKILSIFEVPATAD